MSRWILLIVLMLPTFAARRARACGPDFAPAWLADRQATLLGMSGLGSAASFDHLIHRLIPPPREPLFRSMEQEEPEDAREGGSPRETALYRLGAQAFQEGNKDSAAQTFRAVLALPPSERHRFSTFSAYMLGRISTDPVEAARHYAQVRTLVRNGFDDPLGLAVSSMGQEARLWIERDPARAVSLYLEQASYGSGSAHESLRTMASRLADEALVSPRILETPIVRRLLTVAVPSMSGWWSRDPEAEGTEKRPPDLLDLLAVRQPVEQPDILAVAAYRSGRFELADALSRSDESPLGVWVRAKLAARRGDRAGAESLLRRAHDRNTRLQPAPIPPDDAQQIAMEQAVTALSRGAWTEALGLAIDADSWRDAAQIAERILTVDELLGEVRRRYPRAETTRPPCSAVWEQGIEPPRCRSWGEVDIGPQLRALLARRLLRDGRGDEALSFFDDPALKSDAAALVALRKRIKDPAIDKVDHAQALWEAGRLLRQRGLGLVGTELAPDWAMEQGNYVVTDFEPAFVHMDAPAADAGHLSESSLVTSEERRRVNNHAPSPDKRFHYRFVAAALAEEASGLVPPRSQAYATLLCTAARWGDEPERLWRHYAATGARTKAIRSFPGDCDDPDFEAARHTPDGPVVHTAPQESMRRPAPLPWWKRRRARAAGALLALMAAATLLGWRRRQPPTGDDGNSTDGAPPTSDDPPRSA